MSSIGSSGLSKLSSTWGPGYVGTVKNFIDLVNNNKRYQYHIVKAWLAYDKTYIPCFNHRWIILEIQQVATPFLEYLSIHRFEEEDVVCRYNTFEEALQDHSLRKASHPLSCVVFNSEHLKLLVMLDYILGGLAHIHKVGYNFARNNCQHFAGNVQDFVQMAAKVANNQERLYHIQLGILSFYHDTCIYTDMPRNLSRTHDHKALQRVKRKHPAYFFSNVNTARLIDHYGL